VPYLTTGLEQRSLLYSDLAIPRSPNLHISVVAVTAQRVTRLRMLEYNLENKKRQKAGVPLIGRLMKIGRDECDAAVGVSECTLCAYKY